jgi:hypothetical protein
MTAKTGAPRRAFFLIFTCSNASWSGARGRVALTNRKIVHMASI